MLLATSLGSRFQDLRHRVYEVIMRIGEDMMGTAASAREL